MNTLICAGGTGVRDLEAAVHLCAAGLGPDELRVLIIDPDSGNGNFTRAKDLVNSYMECRKILVGKMGPGLGFFQTKLDLLNKSKKKEEKESDKPELPVWSPVEPEQNLSKLLNFDTLKA